MSVNKYNLHDWLGFQLLVRVPHFPYIRLTYDGFFAFLAIFLVWGAVRIVLRMGRRFKAGYHTPPKDEPDIKINFKTLNKSLTSDAGLTDATKANQPEFEPEPEPVPEPVPDKRRRSRRLA